MHRPGRVRSQITEITRQHAGRDRAIRIIRILAPAQPSVAGQRVGDHHVHGRAGAEVFDRDREPDLLTGIDRPVIGDLLDLDVAAVDRRGRRGLQIGMVARIQRRRIWIGLAARARRRARDMHRARRARSQITEITAQRVRHDLAIRVIGILNPHHARARRQRIVDRHVLRHTRPSVNTAIVKPISSPANTDASSAVLVISRSGTAPSPRRSPRQSRCHPSSPCRCRRSCWMTQTSSS